MKNENPKILFVCTEDWFFYSHFLPLIKAARKIKGSQVALVTTTNGKHMEIEHLGVRVIPVDFDRASMGLVSAGRLTRRLQTIFAAEKPDLIHFIALKPILIGGLVKTFSPACAAVYHVTGLGTLAERGSFAKKIAKSVLFRLPALYLQRHGSALIVENPDDLKFLQQYGLSSQAKTTILGGAGIDPNHFPPQASISRNRVHLAFVGRMIATKGVDVLVEAVALCQADGVDVCLDLYGNPDSGNPGSYSLNDLNKWSRLPFVKWHGHVDDINGLWKKSDICVVPTRTREGMPRAMLEAASCARPLIVTDVPGCRHFVRDGEEGFVVVPEDPVALARAITKLAENEELRLKMGKAARQRVLKGFTEDHVVNAVANVYEKLLKK